MLICSRSAKMAPVRAEKKNHFFKNQNLDFAKKTHFKGIFELKTVYL